MFSIDQIKQAHSKVKSGADFPHYIQDLKKLGVTYYETFVNDGHTNFEGNNGFKIQSDPKYTVLTIANQSNQTQFQTDLKAHQQGKSDYPTFCQQAANHGIEKWVVDIKKMTCTYFDKAENEMLVETIPGK